MLDEDHVLVLERQRKLRVGDTDLISERDQSCVAAHESATCNSPLVQRADHVGPALPAHLGPHAPW